MDSTTPLLTTPDSIKQLAIYISLSLPSFPPQRGSRAS